MQGAAGAGAGGAGAKTETFTVVCRLDKGLVGDASPGIIADAAERAHAATRLAQRLLNFHLLRLLGAGKPLPAFGSIAAGSSM